jgi:peptidyl-prolyl cis-trans isomerase SurA
LVKKKHKPQHHEHPSIGLSAKAKSRLAQQKQRQKVTLWASIGIIGVVVLVIGFGVVTKWLLPVYIPLQETVLTVNGIDYNARYVSRMVNWAINYYANGDTSYTYYYINAAIDQIKENQLIKEAAAELGITVSNDEINDAIKSNGLDNNPTNRDLVYNSLLLQKLGTGKFNDEVGSSGEQRQVLAMLLESAEQSEAVKARLLAGESFADITTELSLDSTTIANKGDMGFHPEGILNGLLFTDGLEEKVFAAAAGDISFFYDENKSKQLGYWIVKLTEKKTENGVTTAKALGILVPTIEKAEEVRAKLLAGEDFAKMVDEYSQDTTSAAADGDMGTLTLGTSTGPVAMYAFDEGTLLNEISAPILTKDSNTTGAYWLYKVAAIEADRDFSDEDKNTLINAAFTEWVKGVTEDPSNDIVVIELTEEQRTLIATQSLEA